MAKEKLTPETTDEIQETDAVEIQTEDREPVAPRTQTVVKKSGTGLSLWLFSLHLAWVVQVIILANNKWMIPTKIDRT